jgi:hypothetical protein
MKFKISSNIIPEDSGWTWCSENIGSPNARYIFAKVAGADGLIDLSRGASGALRYDDRTISVTFARFKKGQDDWMSNVDTLVDSIKSAFQYGSSVIYPKTEMRYYTAYGWNYSVSRDGIIQFLTLNFRCAPFGTVHT